MSLFYTELDKLPEDYYFTLGDIVYKVYYKKITKVGNISFYASIISKINNGNEIVILDNSIIGGVYNKDAHKMVMDIVRFKVDNKFYLDERIKIVD